jgi:hypothetical protein
MDEATRQKRLKDLLEEDKASDAPVSQPNDTPAPSNTPNNTPAPPQTPAPAK